MNTISFNVNEREMKCDDGEDISRYTFDCDICSASKGWAQIDSRQDASYFGMWANARTMQILCYAEGDVSRQTADTPEEFTELLRDLFANENMGVTGIDPGWPDREPCITIKREFEALGLGDLLH